MPFFEAMLFIQDYIIPRKGAGNIVVDDVLEDELDKSDDEENNGN